MKACSHVRGKRKGEGQEEGKGKEGGENGAGERVKHSDDAQDSSWKHHKGRLKWRRKGEEKGGGSVNTSTFLLPLHQFLRPLC